MLDGFNEGLIDFQDVGRKTIKGRYRPPIAMELHSPRRCGVFQRAAWGPLPRYRRNAISNP
jgi:hypothetical protein